MHGLEVLGVAAMGLLVGWIARLVRERGPSLVANLVAGLIGGVLGGWLSGFTIHGGFLGALVTGFLVATLALAALGLSHRRLRG